MKKILFIQPLWDKDTKSIFRYMYGVFPPLGIALMASILEKEGNYVRIIDCTAEGIYPGQIKNYIKEKYDFVGISILSQSAPAAYEIAREVKYKNQNCCVVVGGVHATALPDEVANNPCIDICVRGEGEEVIREIVSGNPLENIEGISFRKNGSVVHNPDRQTLEDLDKYPLPAYHLLPMKKYRSMLGVAIKEPSIGLIVSRGCPGRCEYCFPNSLGKKVRIKSIKNIVREITLLRNNFGIKEIDFYDDTFTFYKDKIEELCELLIREKVNIAWSCLTRPDFVTEELLGKMKKAGCHQIMYGVESGNSEIRKKLNKNINIDFKNIFCMTQRFGISIRATYIIGTYDETYENVIETIEFAKYLDSELAVFNVCTPFPATPLYKRLDSEGRILTKDWSKYDFFNIVFSHPHLAASQIEALYKKANREFYFRPKMFLRQLKNFTNFARLKLLSKIFFALVRGMLNCYR